MGDADMEKVERSKQNFVQVEMSEQELQVLQILREIEYGELMVSVKAGKPIRVEEVRKSIQIK